jgi:magnesium transporter
LKKKKKLHKKLSARSKKRGSSPQTIVYTGEFLQNTEILWYEYDGQKVKKHSVRSLEQIPDVSRSNHFVWVNGLSQVEEILKIIQKFFHDKNWLEDVFSVNQRPKFVSQHESAIFAIFYQAVNTEGMDVYFQNALYLKNNMVFLFSEYKPEFISLLEQSINNQKSRIRQNSSEYLFYRILDFTVDEYLIKAENLENELLQLESELYDNVGDDIDQNLIKIRREFLNFKKYVSPFAENYLFAIKERNPLYKIEDLKPFWEDLYDHINQLQAIINHLNDYSYNLIQATYTLLSHNMNNVMKTLTVIATIFMPLTFIVGIYGMNFHYMPELNWPWAYPAVLIIMFLIAIGLLIYFKSKRWF